LAGFFQTSRNKLRKIIGIEFLRVYIRQITFIALFHRNHPDAEFALSFGKTQDILQMCDRNECEIGTVLPILEHA
jgi:hypothetical protein